MPLEWLASPPLQWDPRKLLRYSQPLPLPSIASLTFSVKLPNNTRSTLELRFLPAVARPHRTQLASSLAEDINLFADKVAVSRNVS
jgi:hypothetical protein